jgi:hypothetical protein
MDIHPETTLKALMDKDPAVLFSEAKYKPS